MTFTQRIATITLLLSLVFTSAWADKFSDTQQMFEDAGISKMFTSAYGYALFPTIGQVGFVVGVHLEKAVSMSRANISVTQR